MGTLAATHPIVDPAPPWTAGNDDDTLLAFERGTLDPSQFSHRVHLDHRNGPIARCYSKAQLDLPAARRVFLLPRVTMEEGMS